ncbi:unnamed protein product [Rhizoctonia solani]|uniref:Uncharacterized protein n=1 Tax=Rhizoctonia solani TaxID=456999 RepID=A0A8H2WXS0_9AGAM|nr:unnamed protein product [Rhizoctonia solani]
MPAMFSVRLFAAAACLALARAQILSTDLNGNTVVVSISTDLVGGTTPVIESTVPAATTPALTTPAVSTTAAATAPVTTSQATQTTANAVTTTTPRVVGQPEPTTGVAGPTIYTYTTVDGSGNTQTLTDTYTPTYDVTTVPHSVPAGTIIPYDQYTSIYGGGSGSGSTGSSQINGARRRWAGAGALIGVVAGMVLVL